MTTVTARRSYLFSSSTSSSSDDVDSDGEKPQRKRDRFLGLLQGGWNNLLAASLVPTILAFGFGYKTGIRKFIKEQAANGYAVGPLRPAQQRPPIVLATILIALIARDIWRSTPTWLKRQIPFLGKRLWRRAMSKDDDDDSFDASTDQDDDDLTSIWTIQRKLSNISEIVAEKMGDTSKENDSVYLALFRLAGQLKENAPDLRDERYKSAGDVIQDPKTLLEGMDQAFEYADWAYDELPDGKPLKDALREQGYILLRHDKPSIPGSVSHYIAMNAETKQMLVGVKGTSSVEDMLTDLCGQAVTHELSGPFVPENSPTEIRCHEGIILAARRLADDLAPLVEELFLPSGYKLLFVGHSLGAGVAALCGILLRAQFPDKFVLNGHDTDDTLKVLAFASPPVLDYDAALACQSFCTTIINNSDIVPRMSVANLIVSKELVNVIRRRLQDMDMDPKDWESTKAFMQMILGKTDPIISGEDYEMELAKAQDKVELRDPDHLYCPGAVLHLFDYWSKPNYGEKVAKKEKGGASSEEASDDDQAVVEVRTAESLVETDGTSKVLREIDTDPRMLSDHLSPAYRSSLKSLLHPEEMETTSSSLAE